MGLVFDVYKTEQDKLSPDQSLAAFQLFTDVSLEDL